MFRIKHNSSSKLFFISISTFVSLVIQPTCSATNSIKSSQTVEVFLNSHTIIFGKSVFINCSTTKTASAKLTRRWLKQNDDTPLCIDGHCSKTEKYSELETQDSTYTLEIHKFSETDVNTVYMCSFGYNNSLWNSVNIFLNEEHFEYHPKESEISNNADRKNGLLFIDIVLKKVFPIPSCVFKYNNINLTAAIKTISWNNGIFDSVQMILNDHYVGFSSGNLNVTCMVGRTQIDIVSTSLSNSEQSVITPSKTDNTEMDLTVIVLAVGNSVLLLTIIIILLCWVRTKKHINKNYENSLQKNEYKYNTCERVDSETV